MKKYAAAFGLFGFFASVVLALLGDAPLPTVLRSAFLWGVTFAVLGLFLGRTVAVLLHEAGIQEIGESGGGERDPALKERQAGDESGEEALSPRKKSSGERTPEPIETDEVE